MTAHWNWTLLSTSGPTHMTIKNEIFLYYDVAIKKNNLHD